MDKESKKETEEVEVPYLDFEYDWGLQPEPTVTIPAKSGYIVSMEGFVFHDYKVKYIDLFRNKKSLILFGNRPREQFQSIIPKNSGYDENHYPMLIEVSTTPETYFNVKEIILPRWCPYPNIEGKLVNEPTTAKILRVMLDVNREYGKFLHNRYKNAQG